MCHYQNIRSGVVDEIKVADNECQQVGGHLRRWLKDRLQQMIAANGNIV